MDDIDPAIIGMDSWTLGGGGAFVPRITRRDAMTVPAVIRARNLIAGTLGGLPLKVTDTARVTLLNDLLVQPERHCVRVVTMTFTAEDLLFEGFACWRVVERSFDNYPRFVERIDTWRVDLEHSPVRIDGVEVPDRDVIIFRSPNGPLLVDGARAIRTLMRLDAAAADFSDGVPPVDYFTPAEGADPADDDTIKAMLAAWRQARRDGGTPYIPAALKYNTSGFTPEQLQLAQDRQNAVLEIARLTGIDADELSVAVTSRVYSNQFDRRKAFLDFTTGPYGLAIEQRLSLGDVTKRTQTVAFDLDAFLRTDVLTRYQSYEIGQRVGAIDGPGEVREMEGRPALTTSPKGTAPVPAPTASQFSSSASVTTFDAPAAAAEFKVDLAKRTIRGLAVPYGIQAASKGLLWQFSKGSLTYDDVSRIKLLDGHDWSKPIGRAVQVDDGDAGMVVTFSVVNTPAGDEALLMASELVKDGLSIGVAAGGTYDERDGVQHAVSAPLAHVALTPCPAFDDARVTAVAASKQTEGTQHMKCTLCGALHAAGVTACDAATLAAFTAANSDGPTFDVQPIADAIRDGFAALAPGGGNGPDVVPANGPHLSISEPLPYRFDGSRGEHEFSSDLFALYLNRDAEAAQRLNEFMGAAFDVTRANVSSTMPAGYRPDLYADYRAYSTPVWDRINKGTLTDATPFVVPKYGTDTGLVNDHAEGVEPTEGGFTTTGQTITPAPLSGKVDIVREVVDAGGNPQISGLIWRQVQRKYAEALEAKAVALLDGLTPTPIAIAAGIVDVPLSKALGSAFTRLHFVQGGDVFDNLVLQEDLYVALTEARDSAGRPLYPIIGAVNANGQSSADLGSIKIGNKVGVPAWALGPTGSTVESSYLWSTDDVHGWATPPRELRFEYQVATITLGVWGYQVTANTRLAGVREITYDPVP